MLNFLLLVSLAAVIIGGHVFALDDWSAFDAMVNKNQNSVENRQQALPCDDGLNWAEQHVEWKEQDNGEFTGEIPLHMPDGGDGSKVRARYEAGVLRLEVPKKKLKSII